ncbi:hypothetical protein DPMN_147610 [Dreissena polymorpha]|uniref:Uncharacterized protein n=1 Tax=Dreissena polymorpha TaxID=45954 RepID=A0A9D4F818_DREPO|nr:hypothetical protein DPMN_147610 [Dreissena polymorpha]
MIEFHWKTWVNVRDDEEHTPIHFCCKTSHLVVLHYLLEQNADPHCVNIYGDTPLHLTGLDSVAKENIFSETPLHRKHTTKWKTWVNVRDDEEHTPIHFCCKTSHLVVLHYLLEQNADPHCVNIYGDTPLHL